MEGGDSVFYRATRDSTRRFERLAPRATRRLCQPWTGQAKEARAHARAGGGGQGHGAMPHRPRLGGGRAAGAAPRGGFPTRPGRPPARAGARPRPRIGGSDCGTCPRISASPCPSLRIRVSASPHLAVSELVSIREIEREAKERGFHPFGSRETEGSGKSRTLPSPFPGREALSLSLSLSLSLLLSLSLFLSLSLARSLSFSLICMELGGPGMSLRA